MRVRLSERAEQDLLDIASFIATDSPIQAEIYTDRLERACFALADNALRFALIPRYEHFGYRRKPFERYAIIYLATEEEVLIVRIAASARDLENLLG